MAKNNKPEILIALTNYPPDYSGAGLRAYRMNNRLSQKYGKKFQILCSKTNNSEKNKLKEESDKHNQRNVTRIATLNEEGIFFPIYVIITFFKINIYLIKNHKKVKLIHFFSFPWFNRLIMLSNILFYHKKTILDITLNGSDDPTSLLKKGKRNKLFSKFTEYLLKRIDTYIVSSEGEFNSCINLNINKKKIHLLPHACDEKIFGTIPFSKKIDIRKELNLPINKFILLNIGRIQHRKNQMFLIESIKMLNDKKIILLLIGPDDNDQYSNKLKNYIKNNNLTRQIFILGEKKDINKYMIASDLLVFSSSAEGFPNVISESIMSGLPIITTHLEVIEPYINKKTGILIHNKESFEKKYLTKFVDAIKKAQNNNLFNRYEVRNFGIVNLSSKKIDAQINKIYQDLINLK